MAKIVLLSLPAYGHVNPELPIVAELVRRGHVVVVCNDGEFEGLFRAVGAAFVPYPPAMSLADLTDALARGNLIAGFDLILRAAGPLLDFCLAELPRLQPDVLVFDATCLWGEMAAKKLKLRSVSISPFFVFELMRHLIGPAELWGHSRNFLPGMHLLVRDWFRLTRFGVGNFPLHSPMFPMRGDRTLLLTSRELHPASPLFDNPNFVFVGPSIDPATRTDSFDFARLDGRPLIYISLGTLHYANDRFFVEAMAALADYPAQFLLSAGRGSDTGRFRDVPANFVVEETLPQLAVLERASLFVTHAGLNSMHEALWYGVPMVIVPQQFEQLRNALTAKQGGAAIVLDDECFGRPVGGPALRLAIEQVSATPGYRASAKALGRSLHEAGGFRAAASQIEAVAAGK
ncbi:MAG: glycosyltransferase [Devosia sp.]|nr:glycosyltransferase [Devosia sp.]